MDSGRPPRRIGHGHLHDQSAYLASQRRPPRGATVRPGQSGPEASKPIALPSQHGVRLNVDQGVPPTSPGLGKTDVAAKLAPAGASNSRLAAGGKRLGDRQPASDRRYAAVASIAAARVDHSDVRGIAEVIRLVLEQLESNRSSSYVEMGSQW